MEGREKSIGNGCRCDRSGVVFGGKARAVDVDWYHSDPIDYSGHERIFKDEGRRVGRWSIQAQNGADVSNKCWSNYW